MFLICVGKHKKRDVATVFVDNRAENYSDWREKKFRIFDNWQSA